MKAEWTNNDSLTTSQTTKAILVIDKAESCTSCLLAIYYNRWFCLKTLKDIDITDRYNIPEWCPLKPMPKKTGQKPYCRTKQECVNLGWDACIDVITGEIEIEEKQNGDI